MIIEIIKYTTKLPVKKYVLSIFIKNILPLLILALLQTSPESKLGGAAATKMVQPDRYHFSTSSNHNTNLCTTHVEKKFRSNMKNDRMRFIFFTLDLKFSGSRSEVDLVF